MEPANVTENPRHYDVAILGAGYAGLMAALRLRRGQKPPRVVLINASDRFLERVRLQESIVTEIAPRIPSLSAFLKGSHVEFICGNVISLDAEKRCICLTSGGQEQTISFGEAIYALGSRAEVEGVPGAAEHAYRLEAVEGPRSPSALRARLRENAGQPIHVITVGGAETSVEVAGEIKAAWPGMDVTMITSSRCGGFKGERVEAAIRAELDRLGVTMIDRETVTEVRPTEVATDRGGKISFDICVWSGGLRSPPIASRAGLATDPRGRILGRRQPAIDFPSPYHRRRGRRSSGRADRRALPAVGVGRDHLRRLCRRSDAGAAKAAIARSVQLLNFRPGHRHRP